MSHCIKQRMIDKELQQQREHYVSYISDIIITVKTRTNGSEHSL